MKIALLYPRWTVDYGVFGHFARRAATFPPLNLGLLAAILENRGHDVSIVDGEALRYPQDKMVTEALKLKPDLIGLTAYSPFFHVNDDLAQALKAADSSIPIAIGGPHITIMEEKALLPVFDYLFLGEAEASFPQFLEQYETGGDLSQVKGIIFRRNGEVVNTGSPEPMAMDLPVQGKAGKATKVGGHPLDQFPLPARHLLPMDKYRMGTMHGRLHFTSIQTMRGCPWKCIFCASDVLNTTRVVMRSPRSVVDEMKSVVSDYGIKHFMIVDDVLTLYKNHILEICDLLLEEKLDVTFESSTRANLVDDELVKRMSEAGLIRLSFGLETVDSEMRKTMKKKVPLEAYTNANRICEKYDVEALNSVMIGLPGETRETVKKTLDFLRNAREVKQANFAIAVPYPGTEFSDMATMGTHGVELTSQNFKDYRRYGSAVTKVGELSPQDLIDLQNDGFLSIYSAPWRWKPMLKKHGILGALLMLLRVARLWRRKIMKAAKPFRTHPGFP